MIVNKITISEHVDKAEELANVFREKEWDGWDRMGWKGLN